MGLTVAPIKGVCRALLHEDQHRRTLVVAAGRHYGEHHQLGDREMWQSHELVTLPMLTSPACESRDNRQPYFLHRFRPRLRGKGREF